jgi:predicted acylesterase/phospholipase RssA
VQLCQPPAERRVGRPGGPGEEPYPCGDVPRAPGLASGREVRSAGPAAASEDVDTVPDGYFVGLAISGGGSRSANFAAACMFQLQRIGLLRRVDYIASVSGGSLAAAYYCLHGDGPGGWNPGEVESRLTHPFANDMLIQGLMPWTWAALMLTDYDRDDMLAKTLQDHLFTAPDGHGQTYGDLRPDRPRLLITATDLQSGRRFIYCDETFNQINSDLSKYPVAYAVAATSSVPVLLHEVTLRDFSTVFPEYRHLIDGTINDNLGIETLVETYRSQEESARSAGRPDPYPNGAVFIVLDARVEYDQDISTQSDTGFINALTSAAGLTGSALLNRASAAALDDVVLKNAPDAATAKDVRDAVTKLDADGYVEFNGAGSHRIRVARMALTQLENVSELPYRSFQESVNSTSTYFNIDPEKAYQLYVAAELLMRNKFEPALGAIVREMDAGGGAAATTRP